MPASPVTSGLCICHLMCTRMCLKSVIKANAAIVMQIHPSSQQLSWLRVAGQPQIYDELFSRCNLEMLLRPGTN